MSETSHDPSGAQSIFRLIYRSRSQIAQESVAVELGAILRTARQRNRALNVTGALMLYDGWFAQALEGARADVEALLNRIEQDPRHTAVAVKSMDRTSERVFAGWNMAHVGEHGHADIPMLATQTGVAEGEAWKTTREQDKVLAILRDLTRGYGIGS